MNYTARVHELPPSALLGGVKIAVELDEDERAESESGERSENGRR